MQTNTILFFSFGAHCVVLYSFFTTSMAIKVQVN